VEKDRVSRHGVRSLALRPVRTRRLRPPVRDLCQACAAASQSLRRCIDAIRSAAVTTHRHPQASVILFAGARRIAM
jgi:hypothetical protein